MAKRFSSLTPESQETVIKFFCLSHNYQARVPHPDDHMADPIANPETPREFLERLMDEWPVKMAVIHRAVLEAQAATPTLDRDL
jgi:hypothetical protein